jgi:F-type H+-transporting ATPase subunit epsilon
MNNFELEIVTPEAKLFTGFVQSVQVPGSQGSFQVLYNHAPIISTLGKGRLRFVDENGQEGAYQTEDGVIEVLNNKAIVLVEKATEDTAV